MALLHIEHLAVGTGSMAKMAKTPGLEVGAGNGQVLYCIC